MAEGKDIPQQREGAESNVYHDVELPGKEEAVSKYVQARSNLLSINRWHELAGKLSARFILTDPAGRPVERLPLQGDYIKIHLPLSASDKFDWVVIEKIDEEDKPQDEISRITIRVRPTEPPREDAPTQHFFSSEATSNFIVERKGNRVSAMVRGRNEKPNVEPDGVIDKVRNVAIAIGAMLGLNTPQWKALTKGIIEESLS